jgi:hypothetical protein
MIAKEYLYFQFYSPVAQLASSKTAYIHATLQQLVTKDDLYKYIIPTFVFLKAIRTKTECFSPFQSVDTFSHWVLFFLI